ncbi:MAG: amidohydrolase family protein, partial [SAR324 cluster bacterium]|nr:amidohydrolase family protein [SAR324 cluster bacterium]
FGPERCMFESNFPVDKECVSYRTLWNFFKKISIEMNLSKADKDSVFSETAKLVYRL